MTNPNTMTDAELRSSVTYLERQIAYLDGETPLSTADEAMIRERNDYQRELRCRAARARASEKSNG